jgi:predicted metal-dependent phosphoesterase TrpH
MESSVYKSNKDECTFKIDLHLHTGYSRDAFTTPEEAVRYARIRGLNGIAVTDHDTLKGASRMREMAPKDFVIVVGMEIAVGRTHIVALDLTEEPKGGTNIPDVVENIHDAGGIAVLAHPYSQFQSERAVKRAARLVDAIEVANSKDILFRIHLEKAEMLARDHGRGFTAGSDSHIPETIGDAYLSLNDEPRDLDDLIASILKGEGRVFGRRTRFKHRFIEVARKIL